MSSRWHFEHEGRRLGPFDFRVLQALAQRGKLRPDTRVWLEAVAEGRRADSVIGLEFGPAPALAPVPASAPAPVPVRAPAPVQTAAPRAAVLPRASRGLGWLKVGLLVFSAVVVIALLSFGVRMYRVLQVVQNNRTPPQIHVSPGTAQSLRQSQFDAVPLFAALKTADPGAFASLRQEFLAGIRDGITQREMSVRIRTLFTQQFLSKYLRTGPDEPLAAYWKIQLDELRELRQLDPRYCREFLFPSKDSGMAPVSDLVSKETLDQDMTDLVDLVRQTGLSPQATPTAAEVQESLRRVARSAEAQAPGAAAVLNAPARYADEPEVVCDSALAFYGAVLDLPVDRSGPVLRYLSASGNRVSR